MQESGEPELGNPYWENRSYSPNTQRTLNPLRRLLLFAELTFVELKFRLRALVLEEFEVADQ